MTCIKLDDEGKKLVEENMRLVPYTINRYFGHDAALDEDLISIGYIGLCRAASTFDRDAGYKFSTYAVPGILLELRRHFRRENMLKRASPEYGNPISLNTKIESEDGDAYELIDILPDNTEHFEKDVDNKLFCDPLWQYVPTFERIAKEDTSYRAIAREERKSFQGIQLRAQRELRRARLELDRHGVVAV